MYWPFRSHRANARCTIYVPCLSGSAQQDLARWYHEGLNAFEQTCPIGMALFEQYETLLKSAVRKIKQILSNSFSKRKNKQKHCV